jgi:hypothetical protein
MAHERAAHMVRSMAAHTAPPTQRPAVATGIRRPSLTRAVALDATTYWTAMVGIYLAYGVLWFYSAKAKLFDENATMPAGLAKAYDGHFLASFPGVDVAWLLLGVLEGVAFLVVVASLVTGEFLPGRRKPVLLAALAVSMLTFGVMTVAQNSIGNHDSVASLFTYLGVTAVLYALVRSVPPFRGSREPA